MFVIDLCRPVFYGVQTTREKVAGIFSLCT